jgi:hypoxanthine phosphoribosyltransferase
LIVEDILETGVTLSYLKQYLQRYKPKSVKTCVMIDKYERRKVDVQAEYVCHKVKEGFLVGYGLDYAEAYRHLPGIFHLTF